MAGWEVRPDKTVISTRQTYIHTINGNIDDISTCLGTGKHTSNSDTGGIVRVNVNRQVRVSLSDSTNQSIISLYQLD
jgi:hypothetical protein